MKRYLDKLAMENSPEELRLKLGKFAGFLGLLSNLFLGLLKVFLGVMTHSVSITADAINNLGDSASSLLTLFGFVIGEKPADKEHPFGHERFELISGLLISILIIFVGLQFLKTSILRILTPQPVKMTPVVLILLIVSIGIKFWQSYSYKTIAGKISSETLMASSQDSLNDCLTTGVVLVSAMVQSIFHVTIDGYVGSLIALYILYSGLQMVKEFVASLMGAIPSEEKIVAMKNLLKSYRKIISFHDLLVHSYGANNQFATVHVEIDDRYSLEEAHEIIDSIEKDFLEKLNIHLVCHVDAVDLTNPRRQEIRKKLRRFVGYLDEELSIHDVKWQKKEQEEFLSFDIVVPKHSRFTDEELLERILKYCGDEFNISHVQVNFDHNYLLANS